MPDKMYPTVSRLDGEGEVSGSGWYGVASITAGEKAGSAVLTESGLHLLTAFHVVDDSQPSDIEVSFPSRTEQWEVQDITLHPDARVSSYAIYNDLALVTLERSAPPFAERYSLYEQDDEVGQNGVITGYGQGMYPDGTLKQDYEPTLREGLNTIDTTGEAVFSQGSLQDQLLFDYDDGTQANDTIADFTGEAHLGLGMQEAMITPGDSGGGLFLKDEDDWLLAGVHSNTSNDGLDPEAPLGDIGVATRVSSYTDWIFRNTAQKQQVRAEDTEPPSREEVPTKVEEGKGVYFLVEIPGGAARPSSVDFFTRDGTAEAGLDYIPTSGEIEFEQGDKWAKVWVQTLADSQMEGEEDFELVLTNPEGADFPDGKTELSAFRTISEEDVQLSGVTDLSPELFGDVA